MARDTNGTYTLEFGSPSNVLPGTTIQSAWANGTLDDIAEALTSSLDRNGRGGMLAPFKFAAGTVNEPGIAWSAELNTGIYWAGLGDMRVSILATDNFRWTTAGADIWAAGQWNPVVYAGGAGGMPDGSTDFQTLSWNETGQLWEVTSNMLVNYTTGDVTIIGDVAVGGDIVMTPFALVDDRDVSADGTVLDALNTNFTNHAADIDIHFGDAIADGLQYARKDNAWAVVAASGAVIPAGTDDGNTLKWDVTGSAWINAPELTVLDSGNVRVAGSLEVGTSTVSIELASSGMRLLTNTTARVTIDAGGNVGIGTTTPAGPLDVNGKIFTEGQEFLSGAKFMKVVAALPVPTDNDTLYFIATPP